MIFSIFVFGLFLTLIKCEAYVLLQVRKHDANHSNVDALIHKVVPSGKFDKFAERMGHSTSEKPLNKKHVNKAVGTDEEGPDGLAIPEPQQAKELTLRDILARMGRKLALSSSGPMFRSRSEGYLFTPETVQMRSGPSSVYKVQPDSVVAALTELLSSQTLRQYVDKLSRKAAVVFRAVETDLHPLAGTLMKLTL